MSKAAPPPLGNAWQGWPSLMGSRRRSGPLGLLPALVVAAARAQVSCDCACYWNGYECATSMPARVVADAQRVGDESGSNGGRCDGNGCGTYGESEYCFDGHTDDFGCDNNGDEAGPCCGADPGVLALAIDGSKDTFLRAPGVAPASRARSATRAAVLGTTPTSGRTTSSMTSTARSRRRRSSSRRRPSTWRWSWRRPRADAASRKARA